MSNVKGMLAGALCLGGLVATSPAEVNFEQQIYPIIADRCISCHCAPYVDARTERTKNPKAGLRMDKVELLMKGAEDEGDFSPVIVPGKPEKSSFYRLTTLDADSDDIMPPKGDPLTKEQQTLIKTWIAEGAKTGGFKIPAYTNPKAKK